MATTLTGCLFGVASNLRQKVRKTHPLRGRSHPPVIPPPPILPTPSRMRLSFHPHSCATHFPRWSDRATTHLLSLTLMQRTIRHLQTSPPPPPLSALPLSHPANTLNLPSSSHSQLTTRPQPSKPPPHPPLRPRNQRPLHHHHCPHAIRPSRTTRPTGSQSVIAPCPPLPNPRASPASVGLEVINVWC